MPSDLDAGTPVKQLPDPHATPLTVGHFGPNIESTSLAAVSLYYQILFLKQVGQTLVESGPLGEILPGLAQSWKISEDGLSYSFKLRKAQFHSGHPVTAKDVVYSINLAIYSAANVASLYLTDLDGYESGKQIKKCSGIKPVGDDTVTLHLKRPFSPLLKVLSSGTLAITRASSSPSSSDIFNGSGPYKFLKREGDKVFLAAFDKYSGVYPATISDGVFLSEMKDFPATARPRKLPDYDILAVGDNLSKYNPETYTRLDTPAIVEGGFYVNMRLKKYRESRDARMNLLSLLWLASKQVHFSHPGQSLTDIYPQGMFGHQDARKSYADFTGELERRAGKVGSSGSICVSFHTMLGTEEQFRTEIKRLSGKDVTFVPLGRLNALKEWQTYKCDALFMTWQSLFLDPESAITPLRFLKPFSDQDLPRFTTLSRLANASGSESARIGFFDQIADVIFNSGTYLPIYQPNHVQFLKKTYRIGSSTYRYQPMISEIERSAK